MTHYIHHDTLHTVWHYTLHDTLHTSWHTSPHDTQHTTHLTTHYTPDDTLHTTQLTTHYTPDDTQHISWHTTHLTTHLVTYYTPHDILHTSQQTTHLVTYYTPVWWGWRVWGWWRHLGPGAGQWREAWQETPAQSHPWPTLAPEAHATRVSGGWHALIAASDTHIHTCNTDRYLNRRSIYNQAIIKCRTE